MTATRILLIGGGYVGLYTALRLEHQLTGAEAEITMVDPENFMVYRPLLAEVASGTLEPRHAVVPLRGVLRRTRIITGRLTTVDTAEQVATVVPYDGERLRLPYDHIVVGVGAMAKLLPVPGLAESGIGFNSVAEAMYLRDHVLRELETAASSTSPERRRKALTFVFVGGGYTGVEALAELQDMAGNVLSGYPELRPDELRWVLVEAQDRILNTVAPSLAEHALRELRDRGIEVRLGTRLDSALDGVAVLSDGTRLPTDTLVWVTGTKPNRVVTDAGLPADEKGRIPVDEFLRARGGTGIWAAGDCAAVPDLRSKGKKGLCPPTAQYAVRQANALGDNLVAVVRGRSPRPFRYRNRGEFVTLGRHKAVGDMLGVKVTDLPAWVARRLYYLSQIPTWNRRLRISADWLIGLPFRHDVINLGSREQPRAAFEDAARVD
ncbi:MAG TPA: NAD(P)/FAD-dependent oxidoreductase [Pseudonocardiaceae bacterium]|jgi:NADH dehydrogenase|nr:NAD(P)/FAD-dependent oxidoreductase [Pseudonocardiaceae bacterium]